MSDKTIARISKYSSLSRPLLFALVLLLHVGVIFLCNFKQAADKVETMDYREAEVFKLVDIQEYVKPAPPPPPVVKKENVKVTNQPKAAEKIIETKEEVKHETEETVEEVSVPATEEIEYLPQHKISAVPVIPSKDVLARIVYPPMALKQGIEAVVYLELFIDSRGVIRNIKVLKDPGHGFAEAAVTALSGITCIPANANGKACAVRYRYPVKFTLN